MSTCHPRRVTRRSAERTFANLARRPSQHDEPVAELLAALVVPSADWETAGERQALSALQTARQSPIAGGRTATVGRRVRQLLAIKAAVAVTILLVSGIAVAAGADELSRALNGDRVDAASRRAAPASGPGVSDHVASRSASHSAAPLNPDPTPGESTAALIARCRAFNALNSNGQGNALRDPAFAELIHAALGRNNVTVFCAVLLAGGSPVPHSAAGSPEASRQPVHPSHPAHPNHPSQAVGPIHPAHPNHPSQAVRPRDAQS